jgi:hypothetical protein
MQPGLKVSLPKAIVYAMILSGFIALLKWLLINITQGGNSHYELRALWNRVIRLCRYLPDVRNDHIDCAGANASAYDKLRTVRTWRLLRPSTTAGTVWARLRAAAWLQVISTPTAELRLRATA